MLHQGRGHDEFSRQDRSYRLSILATHWLQGGTQFTPSAIDEALGLQMKMTDRWASYSDLADLLEQTPAPFAIVTVFALNQVTHSCVHRLSFLQPIARISAR